MGKDGGGGVARTISIAVAGTVLGGLILFFFTHQGGVFNPPTPTPTPALAGVIDDVQLANGRPCCTYSVGVTIYGFNNQQCDLNFVVINSDTGQAFSEHPGVGFTPNSDLDQARSNVQVPISTRGHYVVRFLLYDPHGVELARKEATLTVS